jgi:hypothetical protein
MSKAEDKYLEYFQDGRLRNCSSKEAFLLGYHQAEKDLELTWKDIDGILDITDIIANDDSMEERLKTMSEEEYCQEVLKRFKAQKGK